VALSAGKFRFGCVAPGLGCGCASVEVDRFASSSVVGGVGTGAVGLLLTTGFRPAHPTTASVAANANDGKMSLDRLKNLLIALPIVGFKSQPL